MSPDSPRTAERDVELADGETRLSVDEFRIGPSWLQLALVVLLVWALAMGAIAVLNQLAPAGPWRMLPLFALVVATESALTRRWLEWPSRKRQHRVYTLAELVVLLALAPLFLWLAAGQVSVPSSLIQLLEDPFVVLNGPLVVYMLVAFLVWERAHSWSSLFIHLSITADEVTYHRSTASERADDRSIILPVKNRSALLKAFVQGWITGGVLLMILTALVSFDLQSVAGSLSGAGGLRTVTRLGIGQELLLALLIYFLGGLWLISQGRITVLKGRWLADESRRDPSVVTGWRNWALLLIVGLSLLALLLPIGSTYPLFQVIQALVRASYTIISAIVGLIGLLFYFLLSLLPDAEPVEQPPALLNELLKPEGLPAQSAQNSPVIFAGSLFWMAIIALTVVALFYFLSERGPNVSLAQLQAMWLKFRHWFSALGNRAAASASNLKVPIRWPFRRPSLARAVQAPFDFLKVGGLPPKEQVRYLYLSLVRYAGKQGLPRSPSSTPIEFARNLKTSWPDAGDDLDRLTDAFLAARYGAGELDKGRLRSAKDAWLRIRRGNNRQARPGTS